MRRTLAISALTVAISAFVLGQGTYSSSRAADHAARESDIQNQLKQLDKQRAEATVKGDTGFLDSMTADDCTFIYATGELRTKAQVLSDFKSGALKFQSNNLDEVNVRLFGDAAVLTGRTTQKGMDSGVDFTAQYRFTRVYVKQHGQWKLVAAHSARIANP